MSKVERIREGLKDLIKKTAGASTILAIVQSVDENEETCVLVSDEDNNVVYNDVRLRPTIDGETSICNIPAINSWALATMIEGDDSAYYVIGIGKIDKVKLTVGNSTLLISNDGFVFNGGGNGSLVILGNLVEKLNTIESDLNTLKTVFKTWVPVISDGGAALKTAASVWATDSITTTVNTDLANNKITH